MDFATRWGKRGLRAWITGWNPELPLAFGDPGRGILDHFMKFPFVRLEEVLRVAGTFAGKGLPGTAQREIEVGVSAGALALPDTGRDSAFADDMNRICRLCFGSFAYWFCGFLIGHNSSR